MSTVAPTGVLKVDPLGTLIQPLFLIIRWHPGINCKFAFSKVPPSMTKVPPSHTLMMLCSVIVTDSVIVKILFRVKSLT